MNKRVFAPKIIVLLIALGIAVPAAGFAKFTTRSREQGDIIYRFSENLSNADCTILLQEKDVIGKWTKDRFAFRGFGEKAEVELIPVKIDDEKYKAIRFNPTKAGFRRLRFFDVNPGGKLSVRYRVRPDRAGQPQYLYFRILAGKHELRRLRLSTAESEWQETVLDLGVMAFLTNKVVFTFEMFSDTEDVEFLFVGAVSR